MKGLMQIIEGMKSDCVKNYVIAGLDSYLLENGKVRFFECSRDHQDSITPHSHRFDFICLVVSGQVRNRIWSEASEFTGDLFELSTLHYTGEIGVHKTTGHERLHYDYKESIYRWGEWYGMKADQIHSIHFSRGAKVLFFEGPQISDCSVMIQPVVNGEVIKTYEKRDYMFKREGGEA